MYGSYNNKCYLDILINDVQVLALPYILTGNLPSVDIFFCKIFIFWIN